jgi:phosphatidylserine decarboxylase
MGAQPINEGRSALVRPFLPPIHRTGWPFILVFAVGSVILGFLSQPLGWAGAAATLWCVFFFRDPDRVTPSGTDLVVSPADGTVLPVVKAIPPPELEMGNVPLTRVGIFMNVFDVHVNRVPADGTITKLVHRPGRFFNASFDKASEFNERAAARMTTASGLEIAFVQIAGLVARRIECGLTPNQPVRAGERFGIIRFGSRLDVYLPEGFRLLVGEGQRAVAGETVIAQAVPGGTPAQTTPRRGAP